MKRNERPTLSSAVCVLAPGKLLPSPREAVTEPSTEVSAVLVGSVLLCTVTKSLKEVAADPTWVQSPIATRHGMCGYYIEIFDMCIFFLVISSSTKLDGHLNQMLK